MIKNNILNIFVYNFPMMAVFVVTLSVIRIIYLLTNRSRFKLYEELINLAFIMYLFSLFFIVTFEDVNYGTNNYTFFKEILRYDFGSRMFIKNIIGNILLFIPVGFFASYYLKSKRFFFPVLITVISSSVIELTQKIIGRVFDIDDIVLNLVGGLLGYLLYKTAKHLPKFTKKTWFLNIISIIFMIVLALFILNMYNVIDIKLWWILCMK